MLPPFQARADGFAGIMLCGNCLSGFTDMVQQMLSAGWHVLCSPALICLQHDALLCCLHPFSTCAGCPSRACASV